MIALVAFDAPPAISRLAKRAERMLGSLAHLSKSHKRLDKPRGVCGLVMRTRSHLHEDQPDQALPKSLPQRAERPSDGETDSEDEQFQLAKRLRTALGSFTRAGGQPAAAAPPVGPDQTSDDEEDAGQLPPQLFWPPGCRDFLTACCCRVRGPALAAQPSAGGARGGRCACGACASSGLRQAGQALLSLTTQQAHPAPSP